MEGAEPKITKSIGKSGEEDKVDRELERFEKLKLDVEKLKQGSSYDEEISKYEKAFEVKVKARDEKSSLEKLIFKFAMKSTDIM